MYSAYKFLHNFSSSPSPSSLTVASSAAGWGGEQVNRGREHPGGCGVGVGVTVTLWGHGEEEPALSTQPGMGWVQDVLVGSIASGKVNLCARGLLFSGWEIRLNRE